MKKILLFIVFSLSITLADAQTCQSNFIYSEIALSVSFADSTFGNTSPTNWSWNFGDGTTSSQANPVHTYLQAGVYVVCLSAYAPFTNCQSTYCDSVSVGNTGNCAASFNYSLDSLNPNKINFHDSSSTGVVNWQWDFGDGIINNSQNPLHIYNQAGNYSVCLTTIDASGCSNSYCDSITTGGIGGNCSSNFTFNFDFINSNLINFYADSLGTALHTLWNFGDGTIDSTHNPVHVFASAGIYTVCLTVQDNSGCSNTSCQQISTGTVGCTSYFKATPDSLNLHSFNFTDLSQAGVTNWIWDFGDGDTAFTQNVNHLYNSTGNFNVCLNIYDSISGCYDVYCKTIEISNCYALYENAADSINPYTIHFADKSLGNATSWLWDFEDGSTSNQQNPIHTYPFDGWHWVCLSTFNSSTLCKSTYCDFIYAGSPSSCYEYWEFSMDSANSLKVNFYDYSWGSPPSSWLWTFSDGDSSTLQNPVHTFDTAGYYWVCCSISDSTGACSFTDCYNLNVGNFSNCPTNFTYDIVEENLVSFTENSSGNPTSYFWNFGAYGTSTQQNPANNFQNPGTYYVCLTVSDTSCTSTYCDSITVAITGEEEIILQKNISIYPNPANDNLFIEINAQYSKPIMLSLFNSLGELLEQRTIVGGIEAFDFSNKASGLYSVKLQSSKSVIHKKIMIVK